MSAGGTQLKPKRRQGRAAATLSAYPKIWTKVAPM